MSDYRCFHRQNRICKLCFNCKASIWSGSIHLPISTAIFPWFWWYLDPSIISTLKITIFGLPQDALQASAWVAGAGSPQLFGLQYLRPFRSRPEKLGPKQSDGKGSWVTCSQRDQDPFHGTQRTQRVNQLRSVLRATHHCYHLTMTLFLNGSSQTNCWLHFVSCDVLLLVPEIITYRMPVFMGCICSKSWVYLLLLHSSCGLGCFPLFFRYLLNVPKIKPKVVI